MRVAPALKNATRTTPEPGSRFSWGKGLIVGQVALSLLVLFAAGLAGAQPAKIDGAEILATTAIIWSSRGWILPAPGYTKENMKLLAQQLVARLEPRLECAPLRIPSNGLFCGKRIGRCHYRSRLQRRQLAAIDSAKEDYRWAGLLRSGGHSHSRGRGIEAQDTATSTRVAVVNEAMVKHFFAGTEPDRATVQDRRPGLGATSRLRLSAFLTMPKTMAAVFAKRSGRASIRLFSRCPTRTRS